MSEAATPSTTRKRRVRTDAKTRPGSKPHGVSRAAVEKRNRAIAIAAKRELPPKLDEPKTRSLRPDMLGNRLWMLRREWTGKLRFKTPDEMIEAVRSYFDWVENNPLWEHKVAQFQGDPVEMELPKMRAMSKMALCLHIGLSRASWDRYREREGYEEIVKGTEEAIYTQKFEGAAADLLNGNIIARDLGLKDRTDVTSGDEPVSKIIRTIIQDSESSKA